MSCNLRVSVAGVHSLCGTHKVLLKYGQGYSYTPFLIGDLLSYWPALLLVCLASGLCNYLAGLLVQSAHEASICAMPACHVVMALLYLQSTVRAKGVLQKVSRVFHSSGYSSMSAFTTARSCRC